MRYGKDHKENTHRRVVEVASARLRKEGLDGVGVATEHPERGCPAAAFGAEIARRSKTTLSAFTRKLRRLVSHIESLLPHPKTETAQGILATLIGTLQLARSVSDPQLSNQLLKAGQTAVLLLVRSNEVQGEGPLS